MLTLSNVNVFRGETQVLWDIGLEIKKGERVAIIGSNGAGKSSLLATITGALAARSGQLTFNGNALSGLKPYQITQMGLALVPEGRHVYKDMTVLENLEIGAYPQTRQGSSGPQHGGGHCAFPGFKHPQTPTGRKRFPGVNSRCWPSGGPS